MKEIYFLNILKNCKANVNIQNPKGKIILMSIFSTSQLKLKQSSVQKFNKKNDTGSTGFLTDRTMRSERTIAQQKPKKLSYAIKRQLFTKKQAKQELSKNSEQRTSSPMSNRVYHSLESKKQQKNPSFFSPSTNQSIRQQRCKTEVQQNSETNQSFPIETKCSSDKNKFMNSMIRSYGLATCKIGHNIANNHMILINLGLIKQFYLIEAVNGFQCANYVKKNISFFLLKEYLNQVQKSFGKNKLKSLQNAIHKTFSLLKTQIFKIQRQKHDNSGCFINVILIIENHIFTVNCGMGTSIIFTKDFKPMKGSQPHSTANEKEIKRITDQGIRLYRTQFNVKYKQKLSLKGPLRLYPSGSMFTRIMGKSFDKMGQVRHVSLPLNPEQIDRQIGLISQPEISFIEAEDVQFVLIASSGLEEFMKKNLICSVVLHEAMKYSLKFTIHDLANECGREILHQAYLRGYKNTASVIIVFLGFDVEEIKKKQKQQKQKEIKKGKINEFKSPLKYAGHKKSFCKYEEVK